MRNDFLISIICVVMVICLNAGAVETPSKFVTEPAKRVPVIYDVDIVIAIQIAGTAEAIQKILSSMTPVGFTAAS